MQAKKHLYSVDSGGLANGTALPVITIKIKTKELS